MISRYDVEKVKDIYYEVESFLSHDKDIFFTKEEIYAGLPKDESGVPLYTIGSLNSALSNLMKMRGIEMAYVRGVRYYGYAKQ